MDSIEKRVIEQVLPDINITRARYTELLRAEHIATSLMGLIKHRTEHYQGLDHSEIKLINQLYSVNNESEENKKWQ